MTQISDDNAGGDPWILLALANKDCTIRFRVSWSDKCDIESAAAKEGLSVSAWIRLLALKEAGVLPDDRAVAARVGRERKAS